MKKYIDILGIVFSLAFFLCLAGALAVVCALLIALVIGGGAAEQICAVCKSNVLPVIYVLATAASFIGLLKMYLSGQKTFVLQTRKKKG